MIRGCIILLLILGVNGCTSTMPTPISSYNNVRMTAVSQIPTIGKIVSRILVSRSGNDLVVTQRILFRINDTGRRNYIVSESRYLLDDKGQQIGKVERTVRRLSGAHSSSYSFVMPSSIQFQSKYSIVTELRIGDEINVFRDELFPDRYVRRLR